MKLQPFPPRLDTCSVLAALLSADVVAEIVATAKRRYEGLNASPPWSEVVAQKNVAIQRTMLISLYQAMADWLKATGVKRREAGRKPTSVGIRSPAAIRNDKAASGLDLAFLFAAVATSQQYHAFLMLPETAGIRDALLALTAGPDTGYTFETGSFHALNFSPALKQYPREHRGCRRYYEACLNDLKKHGCFFMIPLESEKDTRPRFSDYLERAVFNICTTTGAPNGTGFFVDPDGHALTCYHVLEDPEKRPVYDANNHFTIRYLDTKCTNTAEWLPQFSDREKDVAVVKVMVDQGGFPEFNTLPLATDYSAGMEACLRGFDRPETYPLGSFYYADVSSTEKETAVNIYEEASVSPNESDRLRTPSKKLIKLTSGTFVHGLSGAPLTRLDTGSVFAVHTAWDQKKNWGLSIQIQTFMQEWRTYSPCWPNLAFHLI
jgi:hypothetical protein